MNPLFPDEPTHAAAHSHDKGYVLPRQEKRLDPPTHENHTTNGAEAAADLIRNKINTLYSDEPDSRAEAHQADDSPIRSRHQQFMHELSTSGKSLAEIQAAWHAYYQGLPDHEKHQVWQEFYTTNAPHPSQQTQYIRQRSVPKLTPHPAVIRPQHTQPHAVQPALAPEPPTTGMVVVAEHEHDRLPPAPIEDPRSLATVKRHVLRTVRNRNKAQLKARQHLQSLAFGLGMGALVLLVVLFGFFNEVVIAPFIHPGSHTQATPIILSTDGIAPTDKNEVIIPKLNVELPFVTGTSTKESDIENQLEEGIAHYPSTSLPGQVGNAAFFGHSSNNIFNKGKYKFAFVLLHELEPGDIFYLTANGKVYTYKVFQKKVVEPTETWVLNPVAGKTATAALITCDPPGTSLHRLVVWGEQVTPDPNANAAAPDGAALQPPKELPSNSPTLWSRFYHWATPW